MNIDDQAEVFPFSDDDTWWTKVVGSDEFSIFINSPKVWVDKKAGCKLADHYVIQLETHGSVDAPMYLIQGSTNNVSGSKVTSLVIVRVNLNKLIKYWAEFLGINLLVAGPSAVKTSLWDKVRECYPPSSVKLHILRQQRKDEKSGRAFVHAELGRNRACLAHLVIALMADTNGFVGWLDEQEDRVRSLLSANSSPEEMKGPTPKEQFKVEKQVSITIQGYHPDVKDGKILPNCPQGYHYGSCNADIGQYVVDNAGVATIAISDVIVKPYCKPD